MLGVMALVLLPDRPESTTFLTKAERELALQRMNRYASGDTGLQVDRSMC